MHICDLSTGETEMAGLGLLASHPGLLGKFKEREGALLQKTKQKKLLLLRNGRHLRLSSGVRVCTYIYTINT